MKDENRNSLLIRPALALPFGVKAFYTRMRKGSTSDYSLNSGSRWGDYPKKGAFDIKWYTFAPVFLVHFWIVDNNRYHGFTRSISRTLHRLAREPEFLTTVEKLRSCGWKDWHILSAVFHFTMNYLSSIKTSFRKVSTLTTDNHQDIVPQSRQSRRSYARRLRITLLNRKGAAAQVPKEGTGKTLPRLFVLPIRSSFHPPSVEIWVY